MAEERFDIVDRDDQVIRKACLKTELHLHDDITRVATVFLLDECGRFYLAQRSASKKIDPLMYEAPAHGSVSSWDTYEETIVREAQEEVFLNLQDFEEIAYYYFSFNTSIGIRRHWKKLFIWRCKEITKYNKQEICSIKSFKSFSGFLEYYYANPDNFSQAIETDVKHLKKYFNL